MSVRSVHLMVRWAALLLCAASLTLGTGLASGMKAQAAPTSARQEATALNKEALRLYRAKRFAQAATKFERAYLLVPAANVLYNLARALHRSGDTKRAKPFYEELVLKFPKFNAKKRSNAYKYIKAIELLEANAAAEAAGKARADARQAQAQRWQQEGLELKMRGKYTEAAKVFVRAHREQPSHLWLWQAAQALEAGKKPRDARVWYTVLTTFEGTPADVVAKAHARIAAIDTPGPKPGADTDGGADPEMGGNGQDALLKQRFIQARDDARGLKTAGIGTMIVGGVVSVAGGVLFTVAEIKRGEVRKVIEDAGPGGTVTTMTQEAAARAEGESDTLATAGAVSLVVGGLALASGLAMFIVGSSSAGDAERDLLKVGASPTHGGAYFVVGGQF